MYCFLIDGLSRVKLDIPKAVVQKLVDKFSESGCWDMLHVLFLGGWGGNAISYMKGGIASGCQAPQAKLKEFLQAKPKFLQRLLKVLLSHGPSLEGERGQELMDTAVQMGDMELVCILLAHSADPWRLCGDPKTDTPIHFASRHFLDTGKFQTSLQHLDRDTSCTPLPL